jgi:histidine decarboxylase
MVRKKKGARLSNFDFPLEEVVRGAVGPVGPYCMGYMNPGASGLGYISTLKLSTGIVSVEGLDVGTQGIVSYDRCEENDAYIGQINMLTASSFCGVNGAVWGYHVATADDIANGSLAPLYRQEQGGSSIPVYPVEPLLDAAERLFGTVENRRFPPMPGAHVVCANKSATVAGPQWVWSAIAIAIADDRSVAANLFIEDAGGYGDANTPESAVIAYLDQTQHNVTLSMMLCGADQEVDYQAIYVGYKYQWVPQGYEGCALTCAPYVVLAQNAVSFGDPAQLLEMTISQWELAAGLPPLPPSKAKQGTLQQRPAKAPRRPAAAGAKAQTGRANGARPRARKAAVR